jgi:hypothetical protein
MEILVGPTYVGFLEKGVIPLFKSLTYAFVCRRFDAAFSIADVKKQNYDGQSSGIWDKAGFQNVHKMNLFAVTCLVSALCCHGAKVLKNKNRICDTAVSSAFCLEVVRFRHDKHYAMQYLLEIVLIICQSSGHFSMGE